MNRLIFSIIICIVALSCSTRSKLTKVRRDNIGIETTLTNQTTIDEYFPLKEEKFRDTLTIIDPEGKRVNFMKATVDSNGTIYASEELQGAVVTARFRNIPERNGQVNVAFNITVPNYLVDTRWQLRFTPTLHILEEKMELEKVYITGIDYRNQVLRGYELYEKFLNSIITDSTELMYKELLEIFVERNIPALYAIKSDTNIVSPSAIGVYEISFAQAREYYIKRIATYINNKKIRSKEKKFNKYIKDTLSYTGIRIDSIIEDSHSITYCYSQKIRSRKGLKKIGLVVSGSIFEDGKMLYQIPHSEPLTFYISSFSTMCDEIKRYITEVIERKVHFSTSALVEFEAGSHTIDEKLGYNKEELHRIKENISELLDNKIYNIDSLVITARCSPEGSLKLNTTLARQRGESIKEYIQNHIDEYINTFQNIHNKHCIPWDDSLMREVDFREELHFQSDIITSEVLTTRYIPEEWSHLFNLIATDSTIRQKENIFALNEVRDLDKREVLLSQISDYKYIKEHLYPKLRSVKFDFHLSRKGMVKDTVQTTVEDTLYNIGVQALKDKDYHKAISILGKYGDINSAIAFISLEYNASAMNILQNLPESPKRDYLLAILYSRMGNTSKAAELYLKACATDKSLIFRGNLDPEISKIIELYTLNSYE